MSLVVRTDNGGGIKELQPLSASQVDPPLPEILGSRQTWEGSSRGAGS
jgi:hypothetical protein